MKAFRILILMLFVSCGPFATMPTQAGLGDFLKGLKEGTFGIGRGISEGKIIKGLKEALHVGTENAVGAVSRIGGYSGNPEIKIPLPGAVKKVEKLLKVAGYGPQMDAFELSMNRAAEKAAPKAKAIFWDAIKGMNFSDARKILRGRDNEATLYFKDKTYDRLSNVFKPIIHKAMGRVGVTRRFQALDAKIRSMPFTKALNFDLDQYVNEGALKGLFHVLENEEKRIRHDPAARVTELLKEVFGNK